MTEHSPWHLLHVMQRLAAERAEAQREADRDGGSGDHKAGSRQVDNGHTDGESRQNACNADSLAREQCAEHNNLGDDGGGGQAPSGTSELELTGCGGSRPPPEAARSRTGAEHSSGHSDEGPIASAAQSVYQQEPEQAAFEQADETTPQQQQISRPASVPTDGGQRSSSSQGYSGVWQPTQRTAPDGDLADMV